jgi:hypothetical protein
MNERMTFPSPMESSAIDRLVDGELSTGEERALLASFEAQPDGWRLCALAFLEARLWKSEMTWVTRNGVSHINGAAFSGMPPTVSAPASRGANAAWARVLAVAASIGVAFFLGIAVRGPWVQHGNQATLREAGPGAAAYGELASTGDAQARFAARPSITMAVVDKEGGVERQFELPVVEADQLNPGWLARRPAAVSPQDVDTLNHHGYRVDQMRFYVPVVLDDGRPAIVSLDRATVKYDGIQF